MFEKIVSFVKENKEVLIKGALGVGGVVVGLLVSKMLDNQFSIDSEVLEETINNQSVLE